MDTIQSLRGMNDIKDSDAELLSYFLRQSTDIAIKHGYSYISTPILEQTALFQRSVGDSSDIVSKEMYRFTDKGDNDVCLRPEGTASIVRSFIEKKLDRAGGTHRFFYHGAMFRYERPQKGRLRQFHQFGCETFGEDSCMEDVFVIDLLGKILSSVGISYDIYINSLGCEDCMPIYKQNLIKKLQTISLCEDCSRRIATNPIRVFDCKNKTCQDKLKTVDKITDNLCETCHGDFEAVALALDNLGIKYYINKNLVRGLDYYTKTAFEFVSHDIGSQNAIAGGGRYDRLVAHLGGRQRSAVGFAIGVERLLELIKLPDRKRTIWYMGATSPQALKLLSQIVSARRDKDIVMTDYKSRSFVKHISNATKKFATNIAIIGDKELANGQVWTKDFMKNEENLVDISLF